MRFLPQYPFAVFLRTTLSLESLLCFPHDDEEQLQIDGFLRLDPDEAFLRMTAIEVLRWQPIEVSLRMTADKISRKVFSRVRRRAGRGIRLP